MAGSRRDEQRAFLLRSRGFRGASFKFEGEEFRLREPTLMERDKLLGAAEEIKKSGKLGPFELLCTELLVDEDGKALLTKEDRDNLVASVPVEFFDRCTQAMQGMLAPKFVEEAAKNSEGTPSAS